MVIFKPHTEVKYELDYAWEVFINEYGDINCLDLGKEIQFERIPYIVKGLTGLSFSAVMRLSKRVWGYCLRG